MRTDIRTHGNPGGRRKGASVIAITAYQKGDILPMKEDQENNPSVGSQPWGLLSCIDLYGCDPDIIRDAEKIKRFVAELCALIQMKRFGETQVVHFGEDERVAGFSMTQLIETSLISAHFANASNTTYLDVFSCKLYDPDVVAEFAKGFFKAETFNLHVVRRA
jgi:S-adenosylmethionine/arginine decarboxylase-like enzyme